MEGGFKMLEIAEWCCTNYFLTSVTHNNRFFYQIAVLKYM
jgi:hypothetical protein